MEETNGELMKYLSALCVEGPSTFQEALEIAYRIDDYERVPDHAEEYGKAIVRRIGGKDIVEVINRPRWDCTAEGSSIALSPRYSRIAFDMPPENILALVQVFQNQ